MNLESGQSLEERLPYWLKLWALAVMAQLILFLLLVMDTGPTTPFLYVAF